MNIFDKIFKREKIPNIDTYTDRELLNIGEKIRNKVLVLRINAPYNKIVISKAKQIMIINNLKYIELIGYNLNKQCVSMIVSFNTFKKLCLSNERLFDSAKDDEIYIKDITEIEHKHK